jgi:hypothetical protein
LRLAALIGGGGSILHFAFCILPFIMSADERACRHPQRAWPTAG